MSDEMRRRSSRAACTFWVPLVTVGALVLSLLLGGRASAQATTTSPSAQPVSPFEAGDTAPPGVTSPTAPAAGTLVTPLGPAAEPPSLAAPPAIFTAPPPAPRPQPIYRKHWFWAAVGALVLTGAIVFSIALSNADPSKPHTTLGDMRAF